MGKRTKTNRVPYQNATKSTLFCNIVSKIMVNPVAVLLKNQDDNGR